MKDWLTTENVRNKQFAGLYVAIIKRCFTVKKEVEGKAPEVLIGHHLTFEIDGDLNTENEIPSADCLMFDHFIMGEVFGNRAVSIMQHLAATPTESRDTVLQVYWEELNGVEKELYSGYEETV